MNRLKLLCCLLALPTITLAASFDCAKAVTPAEKTICASPALGQLDQDVAQAYKALLKAQPADDAEAVREEQRNWIGKRDASPALEEALRDRLAELRNALALLSTPTDDAFDALLSMPTAKPSEGEWDVIAPDDFVPENEAALIRYLTLQVKRGAKVNEYRHYGTLLQHAIRAGLNATALWLLGHGADPGLLVEGEQRDALQLSIAYRRWSVFEALLKTPLYARMAPPALAGILWPAALTSPEAVSYLLAHKQPLPTGAAGQCMLEYALATLNFQLVRALPERIPLRIGTAQDKPPAGAMAKLQYLCRDSQNNYYWAADPSKIKLAQLPSAELEAADARLGVSILPYLLPAVATSDDALRLARMKLKRPFEQAEFTVRVLNSALRLPYPPGATRVLLQAIPSDVLKSALDNDAMMEAWIARFRGESPADLAWALDAPSATVLNARAIAALKGMARNDNRTSAAMREQAWQQLLARLRGPLVGADVPALLDAGLPVANWPLLFKLGYRPTDNEINRLLQTATPAKLRQAWPLLAVAQPALPAHAVERMLEPYLPGHCNGAISDADVDKVKYLLGLGLRVPQRLTLCARATEGEAQQPYAALLATGIIAPAAKAHGPATAAAPASVRLVADHQLQCTIAVNAAVRSALVGGVIGTAEQVRIESVQAIDFPGDPRCALVVSGSSLANLDYGDEQAGSFDAGPTPEPRASCPDPAIVKEVWRLRDGKIDIGNFDVAFYTEIEAPVRDAISGKRYFVATEYHGKCGQDQTYLAGWVNEGGHHDLKALAPDAPAARAYERQCALATDAIDCFGASTSARADAGTPAWSSHTPRNFADTHFKTERDAFVRAVLAMDEKHLQADQKAGVFATWRLAAMAQVAASPLDMKEKRRRMAWLLDSPARAIDIMQARQYGDAGDINPFGLIVAWLPASAWDELIVKITDRSSLLEPLRAAATEQGQHALACRLSKAFQRSCRAGVTQPDQA